MVSSASDLRGQERSGRILIAAPASPLSAELQKAIVELGPGEVLQAETLEAVNLALLDGVDVMFLLAEAPGHLASRSLAVALELCPVPYVVVVSLGPNADLFSLAQAGADQHLAWPTTRELLGACLDGCKERRGLLARCARLLLGTRSLRDAQDEFRAHMLHRALRASGGSRRGAARLLGVSRPAVQRMLRES